MKENRFKDYFVILNLFLDFRNWKLLYKIHKEFSKDKSYSFANLLRMLWHVSKDEKIVKHRKGFVVTSFLPPMPSKAFYQVFNAIPRKNTSFYEHINSLRTAPISMHIAITNKCGFNCWHCSNVGKSKEDIISTEQMIKLIKNLQDMGVAIIGFTGGEPLLRKDIEELIHSVDDSSISVLFTTGQNLSVEKAEKLKKAGLDIVGVSLDHYDKEIVDNRRGFIGAFELAINAIKIFKQAGIYTMMQVVVKKEMVKNNCEEIWKMLDFAKNLNVNEVRILEPICTGKLLNIDASTLLTEEERNKLIEVHKKANWSGSYPKLSVFAKIESKEQFGCGAGSQHSYIDAQGCLYPCDFVPISFGNIKEKPVKELWQEMNKVIGMPHEQCFILQNAKLISKINKEDLPLDEQEAKKICQSCKSKGIPEFYKILAGKTKYQNKKQK